MKYFQLLIFIAILISCSETKNSFIETSDIKTFWDAYDQVIGTSDTLKQIELIDSLYLQKGSEGLSAICEARRYTAESFVDAINKYPRYWESVRSKTFEADKYAKNINIRVQNLRELYPQLKPAKIYFTIGALRTGGTTLEDKVLIGTEIALADSTVVTTELKKDYPHLVSYFNMNKPQKSIVFNNIHEYVHTQQDTTIGNSLISWTIIEGVAEFIAEKSLDMPSPNAAMIYGKKNEESIKNVFSKEMFNQYEGLWFWANANNQFGVGDLGYFVGASICRSYYENAKDKKQAIVNMIELDYHNEDELLDFIDSSKYFDNSTAELLMQFKEKRPRVVGITEFENQSKNVDPSIETLTIEFSDSMNKEIRNFRLGPLGEEHLLTITNLVGWSEDGKKITLKVELKPNLRQQLLVTDIFQAEEGYCLEPYLVDITTK